MNNAITQMDTMTQDNAALVEEAAASSRAMQDQANELRDLMEFFRLETAKRLGSGATRVRNQTRQEYSSANAEKSQLKKSVQEAKTRPESKDSSEWEQF